MQPRRLDERTGRFINCPFTADYRDHFRAIVFTVLRSGFQPRCAQEVDDAGEIRFDKICRIIRDSRFGIHDISKTEPDATTGLPRFNMPLELGLFLGAKRFGAADQRIKKTLVLDREPYRYQTFISDIAGQDIHAHHGDETMLIEKVATWLRDEVHDPNAPADGRSQPIRSVPELDPRHLRHAPTRARRNHLQRLSGHGGGVDRRQ